MCAKRLKNQLEDSIPYLPTTSVSGCSHYHGKDYLETVVTIAEKQERTENAIHLLKSMKKIDIKVHEYFHKTLEKLKNGQNVPLPDFYHATKHVGDIIQTQMIRQSVAENGSEGIGTYISSNNEGDGYYRYGPYAFAIDEKCLRNSNAKYFNKERTHDANTFHSLWICVAKEIPIKEETVAFIDTSQNDMYGLKRILRKKNLKILVINRSTSDSIRKILDLSIQKRELPSFQWKASSDQNPNLPPNFTPRTLEGAPEASSPLSA